MAYPLLRRQNSLYWDLLLRKQSTPGIVLNGADGLATNKSDEDRYQADGSKVFDGVVIEFFIKRFVNRLRPNHH